MLRIFLQLTSHYTISIVNRLMKKNLHNRSLVNNWLHQSNPTLLLGTTTQTTDP